MIFKIKIVEFKGGTDDPEHVESHLGKWLASYDPAEEMILSVSDWRLGMAFASPSLAKEYVMRSHGVREDGRPNRPITVYSLELVAFPDRN